MHIVQPQTESKLDSVSLTREVGLASEESGAVVKGVPKSGLGPHLTPRKRRCRKKEGKWSEGRHQGRRMQLENDLDLLALRRGGA